MRKISIPNLGAVLLPTILAIGFLMVGLGLAGSIIIILLNRSNYQIRLSTNGLAIARAGIDDAILRIIRDPNFSGTPQLLVGTGYASTTVSKIGNNYIVYSDGVVKEATRRRLKAVLDADPLTHKVKIQSLDEVQF